MEEGEVGVRVSHVTKFKETKSMQVEEGSVMPSTLQHHFPAGPDAADCWTSPRGEGHHWSGSC